MNRQRAVQPEAIKMIGAKQQRARYFADLLLGEFRDIENPHSFVDFDSEQGRLMCRQTGVLWCPGCGMGVIISKAFEQQTLRCMQCMDWIVPSFIE